MKPWRFFLKDKMPSLLVLSFGYFISYIGTGIAVKYFTGKPELGFMGLTSMEYLVYSTAFSSVFCVSIVLLNGWHKRAKLSKNERIVLLLSGACTTFIIPVSTLILSLPISVMVAMVLMRVSVIIASRLIDFILEVQGLQHKEISWQENIAVFFAIGAVLVKMFMTPVGSYHFTFEATVFMAFYFIAYLIRLYIMNRAKLQGIAGQKLDQRLYFGIEQMFASGFLFLIGATVYLLELLNPASTGKLGIEFSQTIANPNTHWIEASFAGTPYGFVAIFSVFLFLYPGKSATFTGVTNRLVSLIGGTASSLILYLAFDAPFPPLEDWYALAFILLAIIFLAWGSQKESLLHRKQ
jgi:hypothetical protein